MSGRNPRAQAQEADLWVGRGAVARGWLQGPQLIEALLIQSRLGWKKPLGAVLQEERLLTRTQVHQLAQEYASSPPPRRPARPPAEERLGKIVLKVLCDKVLEHEDFSTTYLGRLPRDPEPVALRLIDKLALRHGLWMDFLETVRGCQGLKSPNLVEVLDVGRTDDAFAVVLRYQRGGITLASLLRRVRRLKLSEALRITRELAQGIEALHAAGVVHRDVVPKNVLLGRQGQVQLQNAGVVFEPEGAAELGGRGMIFGTPHFMAPECLRGEPPNPASDVYALGVLAYVLVTGVQPFEGEGLRDLRQRHLEDPVVPPHTVMRALPPEVGELFSWVLAKAAPDRPDVHKLVQTLRGLEKSITRTGLTKKFQAYDPD